MSNIPTTFKDTTQSTKEVNKELDSKVVITGDDILIEYVNRIIKAVQLAGQDLNPYYQRKLESFLHNKIWYS
jgi:hypothetical protein